MRSQSLDKSDLWKNEDEIDHETRSRSCCGCIFFLLVLWIWIALGFGLAFDELATRKINDPTLQLNQIQCGWQSRKFNPPSNQQPQNYREHSHLTDSHQKGQAYLALVICVAPFATALIVSVCLKNGSEEFEGVDGFKPGDKERERTIEQLKTRWRRTNIAVKVIGFMGTFVFEVAAYMVFSTAFENCSAAALPNNLKTAGNPEIGRTMLLLLSAVVVTGILVVIIVALIVILTSENANELAFVTALSAGMVNCGCDGGCPECNAFDCACNCNGEAGGGGGDGRGSNGRADIWDICCCCCSN